MMGRVAKEAREIRTNDRELKAIAMIQKALETLDTQERGRVLTFCIDRARQDFERGLKAAEVGDAEKQRAANAAQARRVKEAVPAVLEPLHSSVPLPQQDFLQPV
jgi:hypothetical protein